jgi:hypothetical protein
MTATAGDTAVEEAIERRERERCDAIARGDVAALREVLAEEYRHTHADGRVDTREELLAHLDGGPPRTTERGRLTVTVDGARATMMGECVTTIAPRDGRPGREIRGVAHQEWRLVAGRWCSTSFRFDTVDGIRVL